jgi:mannose-6-phosphate isomerase-like protein (cupin superfamily)
MDDTPREPIVSRESEREWETWSEEDVARRGSVHWKTLISAGVTQSEHLTMGIASIPPGEALHEHRHRQAEIYLVLEGNAMVRVGSVARPVEAGAAVFIPGDAVHSCENTGASDLRFAYVLATDSFDDVEYIFED